MLAQTDLNSYRNISRTLGYCNVDVIIPYRQPVALRCRKLAGGRMSHPVRRWVHPSPAMRHTGEKVVCKICTSAIINIFYMLLTAP